MEDGARADKPLVTRDQDILGGTPVFTGMRVPVQILLDYLVADDTLDAFLDDFPTVSRAHALAVLEAAERLREISHSPAVIAPPV